MSGVSLLRDLATRVNTELGQLGCATLFNDDHCVLLMPHFPGPIWVVELIDGEDGFGLRGGIGLGLGLVADDTGDATILYEQVRGVIVHGTMVEYVEHSSSGLRSVAYEYSHPSGGGSSGSKPSRGAIAIAYPAWTSPDSEEE
jgi:hypothetical protein